MGMKCRNLGLWVCLGLTLTGGLGLAATPVMFVSQNKGAMASSEVKDAAFAAQAMADIETLTANVVEARGPGTTGHRRARDYVIGRLKSMGARPCGSTYVQGFEFSDHGRSYQGENILACIPGRRADHATAKVMVVSAHYDHLGRKDGQIHPGANDNASGTAGVLALAESLMKKPLEHDVIVALFDAEEVDLDGSVAFMETPPVPKARLGLNLNMDMIGRDEDQELYASGTWHWPKIRPLLEAIKRPEGMSLEFGHDRPGSDDWSYSSDHAAFLRAGIPHLYFGCEDDPDYHKPTDTADKIMPGFYRANLRFIQAAMRMLDQNLEKLR